MLVPMPQCLLLGFASGSCPGSPGCNSVEDLSVGGKRCRAGGAARRSLNSGPHGILGSTDGQTTTTNMGNVQTHGQERRNLAE